MIAQIFSKKGLNQASSRERLDMHTQASEKPRKKILLRKGEADVGFALGFGKSSLGVHCVFVLLLHWSARNFCSTPWNWFIVYLKLLKGDVVQGQLPNMVIIGTHF